MGRPPPSVQALAGLLLGFLAADVGVAGLVPVAIALAASLLLAPARRLRAPALAAALGLVSAARWDATPRTDDLEAVLPDAPVRAVLEGVVRDADPPAPDATTFVLDATAWTTRAGRAAGRAGVRVRVEGPPDAMPAIHPGDRVVVVGRLDRLAAATNPGTYDARAAAARRGIHARLAVPDPRAVERVRPSDGPLAAVSRVRHAAARALDRAFSPADAGLLRSLLLGDRGALADHDRERFRLAGAAHVLAISGAHVALLAAGLLWLLRRRRVGPRLAAAVVLASIAVLVPLTGSAAPVVRSAAGFALFLLGRIAGREPSGGAILATVAVLFLVLDPSASEDPGFRMSFAAAGGLVLLARRLRSALVPPHPVHLPGMPHRPRAPVRSALAAGAAAWLGSTPIAVHDLGQAGVVAVPVGVIVVPLSMVAILCGAAAAAAAPHRIATIDSGT
ncbi:MAG TPA: ComEC/Rec2 family competence protein, partial [Planctomycetota bacterium]|nr:ComEC/Rec2 family competence protein [Planctomycetota bacterium]